MEDSELKTLKGSIEMSRANKSGVASKKSTSIKPPEVKIMNDDGAESEMSGFSTKREKKEKSGKSHRSHRSHKSEKQDKSNKTRGTS